MDESLAPWYSGGDPEGEKVFRRNMLYLASIHSKFGSRLTGPTRWLAVPRKMLCVRFVLISFLAVLATDARAARHSNKIFHPEFDRDIRPILAENCYPCHGPDQNKRKAKLRLDRQQDACSVLPNGEFAIFPGDLTRSKLVERVSSKSSDEVMPPVKTGKKLTEEQIGWLTRWVAEGAKWQKHWSFVAPQRPVLPVVKNKRWPRSPIDKFILAKLEQEGLGPTREAEMPVLLRRLSFDLTGLPATPEQLRSWADRPDPYAAAVEELLASPHFGERMAADWMDIARYADTHGFNNDVMRSMWRWRDWVIEAFNRNLPYDRFITEQLAGDLLPKPTLDQLIATGFNRNHGINSEGGIIDEEYRVEYVADRVRTTSIAWLGLTMECARCHDHKFDPITQKDFYRFFAFFNNVDETGEDGRFANAAPILPAPTRAQQEEMAKCLARMSSADTAMQNMLAGKVSSQTDSEPGAENKPADLIITTNTILSLQLQGWNPDLGTVTNIAGGKPFKVHGDLAVTNGPLGEPAVVFDGKSDLRTEALPAVEVTNGWIVSLWVRRESPREGLVLSTANFGLPPSAELYGEGLQVRLTDSGAVDVRLAHRWPGYSMELRTREKLPVGEWRNVVLSFDGSSAAKGLHIVVDGEEWFRDVIHDDLTAKVSFSGPTVIGGSDESDTNRFVGQIAGITWVATSNRLEQVVARSAALALRFAMDTPPSERTVVQVEKLRRAWLERHQLEFASAARDWREARATLLKLEEDAPGTMVMRELPQPRPAFVLFRGQYDAPRDAVEPGVPEFLLPFPKTARRNRLGLAQWLTDPSNPLTARAVVNRFWQALFGTGIVKTSENFGYQGEAPSHPELLDWLAVDFVESGWNVKRLVRLIVSSATYRQDSRSTPDLNERDPENRLLAHGPRQRLTGEMLRDQALQLSGLLHDEIGGPPVFPYQPTNLYKGIVVAADYPGTTYTESIGDGLYRRSLYTFWKRTVPHPSLTTFDVPDREVCVARRAKTDTPLQALATMNDTFQVEAARKLAERMLLEGGRSPAERLNFAFQLATARKAKLDERRALYSLLERRLDAYRKDPAAAKAFTGVGASKPDSKLDPTELAAYANLASLILNLDETITRN